MKGAYTRLSLVALFCAMPAVAQSWDAVRGLKPGDAIKVQDTGGKQQKGRLRAVSDNAISFEAGRKEVSLERTKVRRVQVKSEARRARNVAIGAGIGLAVGLVTDLTLGTYLRNELGEGTGARALTYIVPIALFGGVAAAASGYKTIYRVR